jgi:exopolysaccharide production protein ExoQ
MATGRRTAPTLVSHGQGALARGQPQGLCTVQAAMISRRADAGLAEQGAAAFCIFFYTGAVQALLFFTDGRLSPTANIEPNEEARLAWLPVYLIVLVLSLTQLPRILAMARANRALLVLLLLPILSVSWSIEPADSLRRGVALLVSSLLGAYLAARFNSSNLLRLLAWGLGLTVILSWLVVLAWPERGTMVYPYNGAWRGAFTNKNALGQIMLLNVLVVLVALRRARQFRWLLWIDLALALILLLQANSTTYIVAGLLLGAVGLSLWLWLKRSRHFVSVACLLLALGLLAWANTDALLGLSERDTTLTGRIDLWQTVWPMVEQHMVLGYGYEAFWINSLGPAAQVWYAIGWRAPNAHNGILEWWLGLGLVGLAVLIFVLARTTIRAIRMSDFTDRTTIYWTILFLTLFLLSSLSESDFLSQNDLMAVLLVTTVIYCDSAAGGAAPVGSRGPLHSRRLRAPHRADRSGSPDERPKPAVSGRPGFTGSSGVACTRSPANISRT